MRKTSKLEDFIVIAKNVMPHDLCDRIIAEYKTSKLWTPARVGNNTVNPNIRNVGTIGISLDEVFKENYDCRKQLDQEVFQSAGRAIAEYNSLFPSSTISIDTGYDLLRYREGEFYRQHVDSFKDRPRAISCSFSLNDDYEGGEFAFFDREIKVKADKGDAIMFPSNFMYPHEILTVTSGVRYSIITWFI